MQEHGRTFVVSKATIRRDTPALEENRTIKRSHGGAAVHLMRPAAEISEPRERADTQAKRASAF